MASRGTKKGTGAMVLCDTVRAGGGIILGLTATPIYNYGDEMHTVMSYINPDVLGSREEFLREWCTPQGGNWRVTDPDARSEEHTSELPSLMRISYAVFC